MHLHGHPHDVFHVQFSTPGPLIDKRVYIESTLVSTLQSTPKLYARGRYRTRGNFGGCGDAWYAFYFE